MRRATLLATIMCFAATGLAPAQVEKPKRGLLGRLLHPFSSSEKIPTYRNSKLNGLELTVTLPSEPVKLNETRQLPVTVRLVNRGDRAVELSLPTEQRIDIYLRNAAGRTVTRWSDNRAFESNPATILINPGEHLEYSETIATRELSPGKVFTVEAIVPAYPELDAKRKSIAAP